MKTTQEEIGLKVKSFIQENFIFDGQNLDSEASLLGSGTIDSTGILEVISFLEQTFGVHFEDKELVAENFDSIAKIQSFMFHKLASAGG
jgi:acyl carrier protein